MLEKITVGGVALRAAIRPVIAIHRRTYNPEGDYSKGIFTEKEVYFRPIGRVSGVHYSLTKYKAGENPEELDFHSVGEQTEKIGSMRDPYSNPVLERVAQVVESVISPKYDPNAEDILRTGFAKPDHVSYGRRERTFVERLLDGFSSPANATVPAEGKVAGYTKDLGAINQAQQAMETSLQKHRDYLASQKAPFDDAQGKQTSTTPAATSSVSTPTV